MEFLQEPIVTVFIALVLSFTVAKIVSFAVSNSVNTVSSSVGEGGVEPEVGLERELRVRRGKGEKRVKFVEDVMIRRIDHYEEDLELLDDARVLGDEEFGLVNDTGERKSEGKCVDVSDGLIEGCEKSEMLVEKENFEYDVKSGDMLIDEREGVVIDESVEAGLERGDMLIGEREEVVIDDDDDDDDWEGIERSELEKVFAEAVNYVEYGGKEKEDAPLSKLSSDVQMQLYGLHKVAVEGPCHEPQPMALMVSARGKWNAWQRLGSMSQEAAMEHYVQLLSQNIPEWMHQHSARKMETNDEISVDEIQRKPELGTSQSSTDKVGAV